MNSLWGAGKINPKNQAVFFKTRIPDPVEEWDYDRDSSFGR